MLQRETEPNNQPTRRRTKHRHTTSEREHLPATGRKCWGKNFQQRNKQNITTNSTAHLFYCIIIIIIVRGIRFSNWIWCNQIVANVICPVRTYIYMYINFYTERKSRNEFVDGVCERIVSVASWAFRTIVANSLKRHCKRMNEQTNKKKQQLCTMVDFIFRQGLLRLKH